MHNYLQYTNGIRSYYIESVIKDTKQRAYIQSAYEYKLGALIGLYTSIALYLYILITM